MTECTCEQLAFHGLGRRAVVARFDGGAISTDGGALLLREVEARTGLLARYKKIVADQAGLDRQLAKHFIRSHARAPREVWLDLDATDDPLHGHHEGRFFHGYYGHYCYLPLYITSGEHVLCARLRKSNIDAAEGSVEELTRIVAQLRAAWPKARLAKKTATHSFPNELIFFHLHRTINPLNVNPGTLSGFCPTMVCR